MQSLKKIHMWAQMKVPLSEKKHALNEMSDTSKPPLDIFSYILTYLLHTWLQFTLNMENSIKQNL